MPSHAPPANDFGAGNAAGSAVSSVGERMGVGALTGATVAAIALPQIGLPPAPWLAAAILSAAVFADFATAAIILGGLRVKDASPAARILSATYVSLGVLAIAGLLTWDRSRGSHTDAVTNGLELIAPLVMAAASLAYARSHVVRAELAPPSNRPRSRTQQYALGTVLAALVAVATLWLAVLSHATRYASSAAVALAVAQACAVGLSAFGATRCWFASRTGSVTRAFALSTLSASFGLIFFFGGVASYTLAWYVQWSLYLVSSSIVFISGLRVLLRSRSKLRESDLRTAVRDRRFLERADALRELRALSIDGDWVDRNGIAALLEAGARNIRRDIAICAVLTHLDGDEIVLDARATHGESQAMQRALKALYPGRRYPTNGTLSGRLHAQKRITWWNEIDGSKDDTLYGEAGWRSAIGTIIEIAARTHFLIFASPESLTTDPFDEGDAAFVEALSLHLAHRFFEQEQQARIQFHAAHDALTGLRNRNEFGIAAAAAVRARAPFAIAVVDIDGFRAINEIAGRGVGDELLVTIASSFSAIDERDVVARVGGDDFAILLHGVTDERTLRRRLETYRDVFARPFAEVELENSRRVQVTATFGAAAYPRDGTTADAVMQRAEVSLEIAKARGIARSTVVYSNDLETEVHNRQLARDEISAALDGDEFVLEYQPTFELNSRTIAGAEALVRWNHPTRGILPPSEFIPFAARTGLMGSLTRWAFSRVLRDFSQRTLPDTFRVYVNLPAFLLDDLAFLRGVSALLETRPEFAQHVGVEITESDAVQNAEGTILSLRRLRQHGIRIAVDDFGTGYSSMAYLKRLPIDIIKIDRSFVAGLPNDEQDAALCEMFLRLTQHFGFVSLAEGIETEAQARWLLEHGCLMGQGFLFSKPLPLAAFTPLLDDPLYAVPVGSSSEARSSTP